MQFTGEVGSESRDINLTISPVCIAGLDSAFPQAIPHCVRTESELLADLQQRKSGYVQTHHRIDSFRCWRLTTHLNSSVLEPYGDCRAITAEFSSQLVNRGSFFVTSGHFAHLSLCEPSLTLTD